jgi:hypothetical protein
MKAGRWYVNNEGFDICNEAAPWPWRAAVSPSGCHTVYQDTGKYETKERIIANCLGSGEANAAFIVEACNSYDSLRAENARLREALETVLRDIPDHQASGTWADMRTTILAALGKAGE